MRRFDLLPSYDYRSDLPSAYEPCAYLESRGAQYIDTGVLHDTVGGFDIKYQSTGSNASVNIYGLDGIMGVNGYRSTDTNARGDLKIWFVNNPNGSGTSIKLGVQIAWPTTRTDSTASFPKAYSSPDAYYATVHHAKLTVDGTLFYNSEVVKEGLVLAKPQSTASIYLFRARNVTNNNGYDFYSHTRMFYAKFYGKDGALLRDFIPCKRRSDGKPGMYDAVNGGFYTNQGTDADFLLPSE